MSKTTPIILLIIGTLILGVVGSAYAWSFLKVRSTIEQAAVISAKADLWASSNENAQVVRRSVREIQAQREVLDTYFIKEDGIVSFLDEIEEIGDHAGLPIEVIAVEAGNPIDKDGLIRPLTISLRVSGKLKDIFYTLAMLETLPKAVSVDGVGLTQDPENLTWIGEFKVVVTQISE
ncbi:hypothetical protein COB52_00795 [Candidatus Kaiserbacteria bacterium]|nr:MAG: hypothetical protein COB52_00795 [Candidatus Kaiserbacteria bacterium]